MGQERFTLSEIAKRCGIDPAACITTNEWDPATTHIAIRVHELVYRTGPGPSDIANMPYRTENLVTGEVRTKIPGDSGILDVAAVDDFYSEVQKVQAIRDGEIVPAIYAAVPDLDPESDCIHITRRGKVMLADLSDDGRLLNLRDMPPFPMFVVADGNVYLDVSKMDQAHQDAINTAVAAIPSADKVTAVTAEVISPAKG